jgi:hypothetical protein
MQWIVAAILKVAAAQGAAHRATCRNAPNGFGCRPAKHERMGRIVPRSGPATIAVNSSQLLPTKFALHVSQSLFAGPLVPGVVG